MEVHVRIEGANGRLESLHANILQAAEEVGGSLISMKDYSEAREAVMEMPVDAFGAYKKSVGDWALDAGMDSIELAGFGSRSLLLTPKSKSATLDA